MKPRLPIELISTFRKKIFLQFIVVLLITVVVIFLTFLFRVKDPFYAGAILIGCISLVASTYILSQRKKNITTILLKNDQERITSLEDYFNQIEENKIKWMIPRIILICILTICMIFLLIDQPHTRWAGWVTAMWLCSVLISIAMRWIQMNDQFMMQDLKHQSREDHSEISE